MLIQWKTKINLPLKTFTLCSLLFVSQTLTAKNSPLKDNDTQVQAMAFSITPGRCVALRQGQTCYQEVDLRWKSPETGSFCLVDTTDNHVLECWAQANSGGYRFDFQSNTSRKYAIRAVDSQVDLAVSSITVAWVYKSPNRPKASWRLF